MTAMGGDVYQADIPGPAVLGDVFNYYIRARDVAAVPNEARDPAVGNHSFTIVDYYAWDFEGSNGGFTATGPDWEWGDPTVDPADAHSGVNVWATKLSGELLAELELEARHAARRRAGQPRLRAALLLAVVQDGDQLRRRQREDLHGRRRHVDDPHARHRVQRHGEDARPRGSRSKPCFTGTTTGNFWHKATFNLTPYIGQTVMIRFHFGSDASVAVRRLGDRRRPDRERRRHAGPDVRLPDGTEQHVGHGRSVHGQGEGRGPALRRVVGDAVLQHQQRRDAGAVWR